MNEDINWSAFRADVAKIMLPIVYKELSPGSNRIASREREAAIRSVEIATLLEQELRR